MRAQRVNVATRAETLNGLTALHKMFWRAKARIGGSAWDA